MKKNLIASISVGVKPHEYEFIEELKEKNLVPDYITIDICTWSCEFSD